MNFLTTAHNPYSKPLLLAILALAVGALTSCGKRPDVDVIRQQMRAQEMVQVAEYTQRSAEKIRVQNVEIRDIVEKKIEVPIIKYIERGQPVKPHQIGELLGWVKKAKSKLEDQQTEIDRLKNLTDSQTDQAKIQSDEIQKLSLENARIRNEANEARAKEIAAKSKLRKYQGAALILAIAGALWLGLRIYSSALFPWLNRVV